MIGNNHDRLPASTGSWNDSIAISRRVARLAWLLLVLLLLGGASILAFSILELTGLPAADLFNPERREAKRIRDEAFVVEWVKHIAGTVQMSYFSYAQDHDGQMPPHLAALVSFRPRVLSALRDPTTGRPGLSERRGLSEMEWESLRNWVDSESDFVYQGAGLRLDDLRGPHGDRLVVLYGKGPVAGQGRIVVTGRKQIVASEPQLTDLLADDRRARDSIAMSREAK